ncbi:MAG: SHOCT domain-containing protein [Spirochaetaceae bacterium]|jgi:putative membrane protein|nr:SHOCT domain-containing protein [Spirochaetaceae bacterium]
MHGNFGQYGDHFFTLGRYGTGGYIMMGLGLILIIVLVYFIFKKNGTISTGSSDSPLELLQKRFINGEINQEEFEEKREILRKVK